MNQEKLISELSFKAVRSSGSGGQHVNKVATKIELNFNVVDSSVLNDDEKALLLKNLNTRLTKKGVLILYCSESRSQSKNKQIVIKRFFNLITEALKVKKKRILTNKPKSVEKKRLQSKRQNAEKKASRKKPDLD